MEMEPTRPPPLPRKYQRAVAQAGGQVRARCASLDLGGPAPPATMPDTPGEHLPQTPASALIYSNVGELRAHLVPTKASRGDGARRVPPQPGHDPLPPPLPKKQLQRAESLPEQGPSRPRHGDATPWLGSTLLPHTEGGPSFGPPRAPKKPLAKSQSLGEAWSIPGEALTPSPEELTFGTRDAELGRLLRGLEGRDGLCAALVGCQVASLARLVAQAQEGLVGTPERLGAELAGKGWAALSILEREPCCQSGDAWYFRVGFAFRQAQLVLAAKVLKPGCCSLGVESFLGAHCSIQRLIGRFTDHVPGELLLPGHPSKQGLPPSGEEPAPPATPRVLQVLLSPDVPYQTLAGFVEGSRALHRSSPGHYERLACLLLLQVCMGLEHLRAQNLGQGDVCPENLLLVQCPCPPGSQQDKEASMGLSLPRLLISNLFKLKDKRRPCSTSQEQDWTEGSAAPLTPMADELNIGMLIYKILHVDISLENALDLRSNQLPEIPSLSIYSTGLKRLALLLLHRDPFKRVSIEQARGVLQVLLWGPRQELFAKSKKTLDLLRSWVEMKRALLLLKFAEKGAGAGGSPGLEEWLCCQYFAEVTEHMLYQVTQVLYMP
ncbi:protein PEAK3 isoform X1 [Anser cygnoides]|uniref:protein PEAK3 isoform X1 n=2 Tax=Anser cygnoides TaxID=8845 RepID=UPI0034D1CBCB